MKKYIRTVILLSYYKRIRDLREDSDKNQSYIAEELSMQLTQYGRYERGERELPLNIAVQLAKYYNVSIDYIAGISSGKQGGDTSLSPRECELISIFRALDEFEKGQVVERAKVLSGEHNKNSSG